MVLITRYIPSINDNNKPQLENLNKVQIVDAVLHNTTVGIINQLMVLAEHANNVFLSLANESTQICQRLNKISSRIQPLIQQAPHIEQYHQNTNIELLNSKPRAEFHSDNSERAQHFTHSSIPPSVNSLYQSKCKPPPNLALLDPYMDDNQKCLKLYTNPDFFIDEWIAEQVKQAEEAKQRRRERREARLKKKSEKVDTQNEVKKVKRVRKVRYDPVTGEKIIIEVDQPAGGSSGSSLSVSSTPNATQQQGGPSNLSYSTPPSASSTSHSFPQPPPNNYFSVPPPTNPVASGLPPPPSTGNNLPPPVLANSFSGSSGSAFLPPPPSSIHQNDFGSLPPPTISSPSFANHHNPPPIQFNPISNSINASTPPPPPPGPPPPPPPNAPPPPVFKAESKPKASDARSDLLTSIMHGISLKPAEERKVEVVQPTKASEPLNVADILARRIAWAASDSDDDDSDDDSDWD